MNNFVVKIQQPGTMKNSQGFKCSALADFLMACVQYTHPWLPWLEDKNGEKYKKKES